jgi:hypothetical protein
VDRHAQDRSMAVHAVAARACAAAAPRIAREIGGSRPS